jgi:8-oxo-dGTP pyrophosphatase MutT (NUDIX family)
MSRSHEREGHRSRDGDLLTLLQGLEPAAVELTHWARLTLRISAYPLPRQVPERLVTSVRCLVGFDDQILVTESPDDVNIWPGGRREPGETLRQTAIREVHEETGCRLDPESLRLLGFLHFEHLAPPPEDYAYPHPDFLQLIFAARALNPPPVGWQDTDGYVQRARLETASEARRLPLAPTSIPFLDAYS